jgi:hypothetical protein
MSNAAWIVSRSDERSEADAPSLGDLLPRRDPVFREALCVGTDPDVWFPDRGDRGAQHLAFACRACPAMLACLRLAIESNEPGVWGGTGHRTRRTLRSRGEYAARDGLWFYDRESGEVVAEFDRVPTREEALDLIDSVAARRRDDAA